MIKQLHGSILEASPTSVVLDVQGVGYAVAITTLPPLQNGDELTLFTHLAVRENAMDLYGFSTKEELEMFELLLTLPKIGPKTALGIMSQADVALIKKAVVSQDPTYLTKMSGIGKKSAEKIVSELKDKFEGEEFVGDTVSSGDGDVVDALITLGYSQKEARDTISHISPDTADTNTRIKEALKLLSK